MAVGDGTDDEQCSQHKHDADGQDDEGIGDKAGDDVGEEGNNGNGSGVGELRRYVVEVVALGTGGGHDGGIADGRNVVAENRTGEAGGNAYDHQGEVGLKDLGDDGDEDAEGTPGGTGGKRQTAGYEEDHGGEQAVKAAGGAVHEPGDKFLGAQQGGHVLEGGGKGEDEDSGNHGAEALRDAAHGILKGDDPAENKIDDGKDQRHNSAPGQAEEGIAVGKGIDEIIGAIEVAGVDQAADAQHHQNDDGQQQIDNAGTGVGDLLHRFGLLALGEQVVIADGVELMPAHGAVVHTGLAKEQHHNDGEQRIEIEGDGADEQVKAAVVLHDAGDGCRPRGNGGNHADGGGGGIDDVGELGAGNVVAVGDGAHHAADGQAVEVVIHKDEDAQQEGGKHSAAAGLDVRLGPSAEGCGAAGLIEQGDEDAKQHEEHEDTGIITDGGHNAVIEQRVERLHMEAGIEQGTGNGADKEGAVNFLSHQSARPRV